MNIINKLLLLLSLSMSPIITVSAQAVNNDFDTFQTEEKYLQDFDFLEEYSYRLSSVVYDEIDYPGEIYIYYAFPSYYDISFSIEYVIYYSNDNYNFFTNISSYYEYYVEIEISNYIGSPTPFDFIALDYIGMNQVIEHDKEVKSNNISIYSSFYNFFTGFFPNEVVTEYHGIFTFIVVGFLLFLVFGFVFFLFRVIRRLVGFK